jgi:N-acetylmuramate 1-kinase
MMQTKWEEISERIIKLLYRSGLISAKEADVFPVDGEILPLLSDGSSRRFFRIRLSGRNLCLAVAPGMTGGDDLAEARSASLIGRHLARRGLPVPEVLGWDEKSGLILFEDLGDLRLHDLKERLTFNDLRVWYRQVIDQLVHMQLAAVEDFDLGWCWDTPRYDRALMISRESHYFLKAFWQDTLGLAVPDGVEDEFSAIAGFIEGKVPDVFLHRDFQSRNIMIKDGRVRFIDYQSGRLGPPGYDLASLLIDPYAALPLEFQDELLGYYLAIPAIRNTFSGNDVQEQYPFLALQRNLQIIGAFSFLSGVRKKAFFSSYILPSLAMLHARLQNPVFADFPVLGKMAQTAFAVYKKR